VQYFLMRGAGLADCVPVGDAALGAALQRFFGLDTRPGTEETRGWMEPFAPFRTLATFHLWQTLGDPA
jgi:3-methyladenine DNA glycosylase/8-oxoguanine DNA glycosylase